MLLTAPALAQPSDGVDLRSVRNLSAERCLNLPPAELATRCPTVAGRLIEIDGKKLALLDRLDVKRGSYLCDPGEPAWRCRRIVVIDREIRGARKRNPTAFVTAGELLRQLATAASVKLGEELGGLQAPGGDRPRTCLDLTSHGCAVQAARLKGRNHDRAGTPTVRRRLWLVEDADGPMLACSDPQLLHCDELGSAGWLALLVTLRPSSLSAAEPPPELDVPEVRVDKRPGLPDVVGGAEAADTPAGALDPFVRPKAEKLLPKAPLKADVQKAAHDLEARGKSCLGQEPRALVDLVFSGEGNLLSLAVDGAAPNAPILGCLREAARHVELPRFAGATYHLSAVILPGGPTLAPSNVASRRRGR